MNAGDWQGGKHEGNRGGESHPVDVAALEAICRQAAAGDEEAVQRLLCIHHDRLEGFARRKVGVDWQGKIDPEDVLQEAYIDVVNGVGEFAWRGEDSFYHWATRIIEHRFIDQVRRLRRKKRDVAREVTTNRAQGSRHESLLERCLPETGTPSRVMRRQDAVSALMGCMARLPEHYRVVVQRVYLDEAPIADVATEMGKTEDAIRRLAGRAVESLKEGMGRASHYLSQW